MKKFTMRFAAICSAVLMATAFNAQAQNKPLEEITYLLPAPPTLPAFAPWMLAAQRGYYAEEGLKINFIAARGGADVAKQVGAGNALMGGGVGDTPIIVRGNGVPVKNVAVLGGSSLMHLAIAGDGDIASLKGKTIGAMSYVDTTYFALLGMLKANGMTKNDVDIQANGPGVWQLFADKKLPALASVPEWTAAARDAGVKVTIVPADRYFKSMAQAIIASDDAIRDKPETIAKFVRATIRGMKDIMADPHGAARDYAKAVPSFAGKEKQVENIFALYGELVYRGQANPGEIDVQRLSNLQDFYVKEGIVAKALPVADLYTNKFVPGAGK